MDPAGFSCLLDFVCNETAGLRCSTSQGETCSVTSCLTEQRSDLRGQLPDCLGFLVNIVRVTSEPPSSAINRPESSRQDRGPALGFLQAPQHPSIPYRVRQHHGPRQDAAAQRLLLAAGGVGELRQSDRGAIARIRRHKERGGEGADRSPAGSSGEAEEQTAAVVGEEARLASSLRRRGAVCGP